MTGLLADVAAVVLGVQAGWAVALAVRPRLDRWLADHLRHLDAAS